MARTKARKTAKQATGARRKKAAAGPRAGIGRPKPAPPPPSRTPTRRGAAITRSRGLPKAEAVEVTDIDAVLASVASARAALVDVQSKLNAISEAALDRLPEKDQEAWADELAQTNDAITRLDTAALKVINADFAARVPELEQKTRALAASLQKMKDVVDIIASVGKVIQIVTEIASLIR